MKTQLSVQSILMKTLTFRNIIILYTV